MISPQTVSAVGALKPCYKRVLLKLSGESLGSDSDIFSNEGLSFITTEMLAAREIGTEIIIVVGGGNIFRGREARNVGIDPIQGDKVGMLATIQNGIVLMDRLEQKGFDVRVMSAIPINKFTEEYIDRRAEHHLECGRVVICVGGTGNVGCSTDTAAAQRAYELGANVIIKATNVDGVFNKDPNRFTDAVKLDHVTYIDSLKQRLQVFDSQAFSICMDKSIPIIVLNFFKAGNLRLALTGHDIGTLVSDHPPVAA